MLATKVSTMHTHALAEFLSAQPRGGVAALAAELKISRVYLSQLASRQDGRVPGPELCVLIERATGRRVMRWNLRPDDWHLIWPELIGTEGAPAPAGQAEEVRDAA